MVVVRAVGIDHIHLNLLPLLINQLLGHIDVTSTVDEDQRSHALGVISFVFVTELLHFIDDVAV